MITQDAQQAIPEYTYLRLYCIRKSTVRFNVYPPDYERPETGGFFDVLLYSKTANVRFRRNMKKALAFVIAFILLIACAFFD